MRNIIIILLFSFSLTVWGQEIRGFYFMDCPIYSISFLDKIAKIDSISYEYALENSQAYDPHYFPLINLTNADLHKRNTLKSIPRRGARIFYSVSPDLKTIYILGMVQNYMIQSEFDHTAKSYFKGAPFGENEFKSEPKFMIPLHYYSNFVTKRDIDDIIMMAENTLKRNIAQTYISLQCDTIVSITIDSLNQLTAYDEKRITDILYELPVYIRPNSDSIKRLTKSEIDKYIGCITTFFSNDTLWYNNYIRGIQVSVNFSVTRGVFKFDLDPAVSKLALSFDHIGINYKACSEYETGKTLWIKWHDFFAKYNDPIFEQAVNHKLNNYLYRKLINNQ